MSVRRSNTVPLAHFNGHAFPAAPQESPVSKSSPVNGTSSSVEACRLFPRDAERKTSLGVPGYVRELLIPRRFDVDGLGPFRNVATMPRPRGGRTPKRAKIFWREAHAQDLELLRRAYQVDTEPARVRRHYARARKAP